MSACKPMQRDSGAAMLLGWIKQQWCWTSLATRMLMLDQLWAQLQ